MSPSSEQNPARRQAPSATRSQSLNYHKLSDEQILDM
jgi:hypothetical protein